MPYNLVKLRHLGWPFYFILACSPLSFEIISFFSLQQERLLPISFTSSLFMLLPLAGVLIPLQFNKSVAGWSIVGCFLATWAFTAGYFKSPVNEISMWRGLWIASGIGIGIITAAVPLRAGNKLRLIAIIASVAATCGLAINFCQSSLQPGEQPWIGLGNVNIYVTLLAPVILGGIGHHLSSARFSVFQNGDLRKKCELYLLLIGLFAIISVIILTHRRGGLLMLSVILIWIVPVKIVTSRNIAKFLIAALGLIASLFIAYWTLNMDFSSVTTERSERIFLYESAGSVVRENIWSGTGGYSALSSSLRSDLGSRLMSAGSSWSMSYHSWWLDITSDYGIFFTLLGFAWISWPLLEGLKTDCNLGIVTTWVAIQVPLMFDHTFSTPYGWMSLALILGCFFDKPKFIPAIGIYQEARHIKIICKSSVWLMALCSSVAAGLAFRGSFIQREAYPSVLVRGIEKSPDPDVISECYKLLTSPENRMENLPLLGFASAVAGRRAAWFGGTTAILLQNPRTPTEKIKSVIFYVQQHPFSTWGYDQLILNEKKIIPIIWQNRLSDHLRKINFPSTPPNPKNLDAWIDCWWLAQVRLLENANDLSALHWERRVAQQFGYIPDVTIQVLRNASRRRAANYRWILEDFKTLFPGTDNQAMAVVFRECTSPDNERLMLEFAEMHSAFSDVLIKWKSGMALELPSVSSPFYSLHQETHSLLLRTPAQ